MSATQFNKLVSISEFVPYIRTAIDGIDEDMALVYITDAIIEFARDTKILQHTTCVTLEPCIDSYILDVPYGRIIEIAAVEAQHDGCFSELLDFSNYVYVDGNVLYIDGPLPIGDEQTINIKVILSPKRTDNAVPETLLEDWVTGIMHLTLAKLFMLPDAKWYNMNAARENIAWYQRYVSKAKIRNITAHRPLNVRIRPKRRGIR